MRKEYSLLNSSAKQFLASIFKRKNENIHFDTSKQQPTELLTNDNKFYSNNIANNNDNIEYSLDVNYRTNNNNQKKKMKVKKKLLMKSNFINIKDNNNNNGDGDGKCFLESSSNEYKQPQTSNPILSSVNEKVCQNANEPAEHSNWNYRKKMLIVFYANDSPNWLQNQQQPANIEPYHSELILDCVGSQWPNRMNQSAVNNKILNEFQDVSDNDNDDDDDDVVYCDGNSTGIIPHSVNIMKELFQIKFINVEQADIQTNNNGIIIQDHQRTVLTMLNSFLNEYFHSNNNSIGNEMENISTILFCLVISERMSQLINEDRFNFEQCRNYFHCLLANGNNNNSTTADNKFTIKSNDSRLTSTTLLNNYVNSIPELISYALYDEINELNMFKIKYKLADCILLPVDSVMASNGTITDAAISNHPSNTFKNIGTLNDNHHYLNYKHSNSKEKKNIHYFNYPIVINAIRLINEHLFQILEQKRTSKAATIARRRNEEVNGSSLNNNNAKHLKNDDNHQQEWQTVTTAATGNTSLYYKNVPGTDHQSVKHYEENDSSLINKNTSNINNDNNNNDNDNDDLVKIFTEIPSKINKINNGNNMMMASVSTGTNPVTGNHHRISVTRSRCHSIRERSSICCFEIFPKKIKKCEEKILVIFDYGKCSNIIGNGLAKYLHQPNCLKLSDILIDVLLNGQSTIHWLRIKWINSNIFYFNIPEKMKENQLINLTIMANCEHWLGTMPIKCERMKNKRQHSMSKSSPSSSSSTITSNKVENKINLNEETNGMNAIMSEPFAKLNCKEFLLQTFPGTQSLEQIDQILADVFDKNVADFGIFQYLSRPYNINLWLPTWLHFAAAYGLKILTENLLNTAGSLRACFVCNSYGLTPIDLARKNNHTEIVNLLDNYLIEIDNINKDLLLKTTNQHVIYQQLINVNNNNGMELNIPNNDDCSQFQNSNEQTSCQTPKSVIREYQYPDPLNQSKLINSFSRNDRIGMNDYQKPVHEQNNKPLNINNNNNNNIESKSPPSTGSSLLSSGLLKSKPMPKEMGKNCFDSLEDEHYQHNNNNDDDDNANKESEQEPEPENQEEEPKQEQEYYYLNKELINAQQQLLMLIEQFKNGISIQTFGRLFADWELLNGDAILQGQMSDEFRHSFNEIKKLCHLKMDLYLDNI